MSVFPNSISKNQSLNQLKLLSNDGDDDAMLELGHYYKQMSIDYYSMAANLDNPQALIIMGSYYEVINKQKAFDYFVRAANSGNLEARRQALYWLSHYYGQKALEL